MDDDTTAGNSLGILIRRRLNPTPTEDAAQETFCRVMALSANLDTDYVCHTSYHGFLL
jgi:hypothetical protein